MKGDRYPRQLFHKVWEVKPYRGRQRKMGGEENLQALLLDKDHL